MNENSSEQDHSFEQDDSSDYDHSSELDHSYEQDRHFRPDHTGGKTLNWILGIITALVAGGIAFVGWNFIDSVQKHAGELKNYHVTADNAKIDSHRYDTINKDVDEHIFNNQTDPEQALQEAVFKLKGSEISFSKGLTALSITIIMRTLKLISQMYWQVFRLRLRKRLPGEPSAMWLTAVFSRPPLCSGAHSVI